MLTLTVGDILKDSEKDEILCCITDAKTVLSEPILQDIRFEFPDAYNKYLIYCRDKQFIFNLLGEVVYTTAKSRSHTKGERWLFALFAYANHNMSRSNFQHLRIACRKFHESLIKLGLEGQTIALAGDFLSHIPDNTYRKVMEIIEMELEEFVVKLYVREIPYSIESYPVWEQMAREA